MTDRSETILRAFQQAATADSNPDVRALVLYAQSLEKRCDELNAHISELRTMLRGPRTTMPPPAFPPPPRPRENPLPPPRPPLKKGDFT